MSTDSDLSAGLLGSGLGQLTRGLPEINLGTLGPTDDLPPRVVTALMTMSVSASAVRLWRYVRDAAGGLAGPGVELECDDVAGVLRASPAAVRRWRAMLIDCDLLRLREHPAGLAVLWSVHAGD